MQRAPSQCAEYTVHSEQTMARGKNDDKKPSGKDSGGKGAKGKDKKDSKDEKPEAKAKGAQSINVRHILVGSPLAGRGTCVSDVVIVRETLQERGSTGQVEGGGKVRRGGEGVFRG